MSLSARCRCRSLLDRSAVTDDQKPPRIIVDEHHSTSPPPPPDGAKSTPATSVDSQLYCTVLFLSVYHVLLLSPDMFSRIAFLVSPIFQQVRGINPSEQIGENTERVNDHRFLVVLSSFLFQVYFAGKAFILILSWPLFRQKLIALVTCRLRPPTMSGDCRVLTSIGSDSNYTTASLRETRAR